MAELSKTDRGDEGDTVTLVELLFGRHSRGKDILSIFLINIFKTVRDIFFVVLVVKLDP